MTQAVRPGGAMNTRDLHFIWLVDGSSSMGGDKIQSLNYAIAEALPEMRRTASENPQARVMVRVIRFATRAQWMTPEPVGLGSFRWNDITADGETAMGEALEMTADVLAQIDRGGRFLPPVLILVTDGHPTDNKFEVGLRKLMAQRLGREAIRLAVAIGQDADLDCLQDFIGNPRIRPLQAGNADQLAQHISFASTAGLSMSSTPQARPASETWAEAERTVKTTDSVVW